MKGSGVSALDRIAPGRENVRHLTFKHKNRRLRFAHDKLRAVFYFLLINRETVKDRIARVVEPFDNLDKLVIAASLTLSKMPIF